MFEKKLSGVGCGSTGPMAGGHGAGKGSLMNRRVMIILVIIVAVILLVLFIIYAVNLTSGAQPY